MLTSWAFDFKRAYTSNLPVASPGGRLAGRIAVGALLAGLLWGGLCTPGVWADSSGPEEGGGASPLEAETADGERGLEAEYFDGYFAGDFSFFDSNTPVLTRTDAEIDFGPWDLGGTSLSDLEGFSVRWTGYIHVPVDGTYTFYTSSSDASYVFLGDAAKDPTVDNATVDNGGTHGVQEESGTVTLSSGPHRILIVYGEDTGEEQMRLEWKGPDISKPGVPTSRQGVPNSALSQRFFVNEQKPVTVRWTSKKPYPFTCVAFSTTTQVTLKVTDASGNPVPTGTPVVVSMDWRAGWLTGSSLFKELDGNSANEFYFTTESGGTVRATYHTPRENPSPLHEFQDRDNPWEAYRDEAFRVQGPRGLKHQVEASFGTVEFSDPSDPSSAYYGSFVQTDPESEMPLHIGPNKVKIKTEGTHGGKYVFAAKGMPEPETASVTVEVVDSRGRPVPKDAPVLIATRKGRLTGSTLFKKEEGFYNLFFFRAEKGGTFEATYHAPQETPLPIRDFSRRDNPWKAYDDEYRQLQRVEMVFFGTLGDPSSASRGGVLAKTDKSVRPVLIGPNKYTFTTEGPHGDKYVFAAEGVPEPQTASVTVEAVDSRGRPVPMGTPVKVDLKGGRITGPTLFKQDDTLPWFFFRAEKEGRFEATYHAPDETPPSISNYSTFDDPWKEYDERNQKLDGVGAGGRGLAATKETVPPVPVGPEKVAVETNGRDGNKYVFAADGMPEQETATVDFTLYDSKGRLAPEGAPFLASIDKGRLEGEAVFSSDQTDGEPLAGGNFFLRVGPNGAAKTTFVAPDRLFSAFTNWWKTNHSDLTRKKARKKFEKEQRGWEAWSFGDPMFQRVFFGDNTGEPFGNNARPLARAKEGVTLPVMVSPDRVTVTASGEAGGKYVFANPTAIKTGTVQVKMVDGLGRPVPKGTPLSLRSAEGRLFGNPLIGVSPNFKDPEPGRYHFLRTGSGGTAQLTFVPFPEEVHALSSFLAEGDGDFDNWKDAHGRAMYRRAWRVEFIDGSPQQECAFQICNPLATFEGESVVPLRASTNQASVDIKPSVLGPFEVAATATIKVKKTNGGPVPAGTSVRVKASQGTVDGGESTVVTTGEGGEAQVSYLSPDRTVNTDGSALITVTQAGTYSTVRLGSGTIRLHGFAVSNSLTKALIGLSGEEIQQAIAEPFLLPFRLKEAKDQAHIAKQTLDQRTTAAIAGDLGTVDGLSGTFEKEFGKLRKDLGGLIQKVPGTSFTGPVTTPGSVSPTAAAIASGAGTRVVLKKAVQGGIEKLKGKVKGPIEGFVKQKIAEKLVGEEEKSGTSAQNDGSDELLQQPSVGRVEPGGVLHTLKGTGGTYEVFTFALRIEGAGGAVADGTIQKGDQFLLTDLLGQEVFPRLAPNRGVGSIGLAEVAEVDPENDAFKAEVIGTASQDLDELSILPLGREIGADGGTVHGADGSQVEVPEGALSWTGSKQTSARLKQSGRQLFLSQTVPPKPVQGDTLAVLSAYAFGGIHVTSTDTTREAAAFAPPGKVRVPRPEDSLGTGGSAVRSAWQGALKGGKAPKAFVYDPTAGQWRSLEGTVTEDSLFFEVDSTGIYGVGIATSVEETSSTRQRALAASKGWNLLSVPVSAGGAGVGTLMPPGCGTGFRWRPGQGSYQKVSGGEVLSPGKGGWFFCEEAEEVQVRGAPVEASEKTVSVEPGWNQVAPFEGAVKPEQVGQDPSGILEAGSWFRWDSAREEYTNPSTLEPGGGYWVFAKEAGTLDFSSGASKGESSASSSKGDRAQTGPEQGLKLRLTDEGGHRATLHFVEALTDAERRRWRLPPTGPGETFDVRFGNGLRVGTASADSLGDGTERNGALVKMQGTEGRVTLRLEAVGERLRGRSLRVVDAVTGGEGFEAQLRTGASTAKVPSGFKQLRVYLESAPRKVALRKPAPNPASEETTIKYALPEERAVTIVVYDVLGRRVATLVEEKKEAGQHSAELEASRFSSGTYFVRMRAGSFTETRRVTVLR